MRCLAALIFAASLATAEDAREIVRRSVNLGDANLKAAGNYTYLQRTLTRFYDGKGNLKETQIKTYDITVLEGSPYRRLVAKDDRPLPLQDEEREQERLRKITEQRRRETPEQRARRIAEANRRRDRDREMVREIPDAFDFRLAGEENLAGRATWVVEATPRPRYHARTPFFRKVKGKLWIDKRDFHWVKLEGEVIDTVSYGAFLVRLAKGAHFMAEQTRVNDEVWLPKRVQAQAAVRVALVKKIQGDLDITFSNYRKFQADSRIVAVEPVR